jgi:hypothetical protein
MMKFSCQDLELFWVSNTPRPFPTVRHPLVPAYRVGEPLQRGRRHWPIGTQYTYGFNGHELTLFLDRIDERLIRDVRYEEAEFALMVKLPVILLAYRFGQSIPWSDVPFCLHMQPAHRRVIPPPEHSHETRALLWITLVGAHDGLIHAQRGMTLAPDFTRVLHSAIQGQARMSFSPDDCLTAISDLLLTYPDTRTRLSLAQARTFGNL